MHARSCCFLPFLSLSHSLYVRFCFLVYMFFKRTYRRGSSYETTHIRIVRPYGLECKFEPKKGGMTTIFVILKFSF